MERSGSWGFDTLEELWGLEEFCDTRDFGALLRKLEANDFGHTKAAHTLMAHGITMLKCGQVVYGPTDHRGRGIVSRCARSNGMAKVLYQQINLGSQKHCQGMT